MEKSCRHLLYPFDWRDLLAFMAGFLPFGGTAIAGVLLAGYGWTLWIWLGYAIFFFIVWEGWVLCSHCPYWGKEGRILHCPANYGVPKLWRYHPEPMSRSEGRQFLMGASLLVLLPMIPMAMGGQWLFLGLSVLNAGCFAYGLWHHTCSRCANFSCPANHVSEQCKETFLREHPELCHGCHETD